MEGEREQLAREIHDTLAQGLTGIGLQIEAAMPHLCGDPELAEERLRRALELTRTTLEEARRTVLELRAAPLAGRSLAEALEELTRRFTAEEGIPARLRVGPGMAGSLPLRVESDLYRVAQEALANAARHAAASSVTVTLTRHEDVLRLSVRDDGIGFGSTPIKCVQGHGILGMRERVRLLGGRLKVVGRPGRGTTVAAVVPLPEAAE